MIATISGMSTTYGYVGDVDGDGASEFMFMSADWHTVHVHDGKTGNRKVSVPLPDSTRWMYTFLARRAEDTGRQATRLVVCSAAYASRFDIAAYDLRARGAGAGVAAYATDGNGEIGLSHPAGRQAEPGRRRCDYLRGARGG